MNKRPSVRPRGRAFVKYIWGLAVLAALGVASLSFAGKPSSSTCVCVTNYNIEFNNCRSSFKRNTPEYDACVVQAEANFRLCCSANACCLR